VVLYAEDGPGGALRPWAVRLHSPEPLFVRHRVELTISGPATGGIGLQEIVVLRSGDGRRALVLAERNDSYEPLAAGSYTCELTYHRSAPGLPTQSVAGDVSDQTLSFDFTVDDTPDFEEEAL
jgi:hypothetical protein